MSVEAARYFAIAEEPDYGIPAVLDAVAPAATHTADRDVAGPSILEVVAIGITTGGTINVPGTINGATHFDLFTLPTGNSRVSGVEFFQALDLSADAIVTGGGLAGGTIEIRIATAEFSDIMDESINADNDPITSEERVGARFFQFSAAGNFEVGGDVNMIAEPEGGFARWLKWAIGSVVSTLLGGAVKFTGAIAATFTMTTDIVPNQNGGDKKLRLVVTGTAVDGTATIAGDVNGIADTEVVILNAANGFIAQTTKAFDALDLTPAAQATTGLTAGTLTIEQGDAISHAFTFNTSAPSFIGQIGKDGILEREIQGLVVEAFDIAMKTGDWIKAKATLVGRTELLRDIQTPAFNTLEPFEFAQSVVTRDGLEFPVVMEATLTINNNPSKDRRSLDGSRFRRKAPWQGGDAELSAKFLFCDYNDGVSDITADENYRRFLGTVGAASPQVNLDDWAMVLSFVSDVLIFPGGNPYSITIDLPNLIPAQMDEPIKSRDVIETSGTFKVKAVPGEEPFTITLVNGQTEI